jgi:endonuclease III-like uncharacterized protein
MEQGALPGLPGACFYYQHWFLEMIAPEQDFVSFYRLFLNFEFNPDSDQQTVLAKAKAMGLTGFHYYHVIADFISNKLQFPVTAYADPVLKTNFVMEHNSVEEMCRFVTEIVVRHVDITEVAFNALLGIKDRYKL